MKKLLVFAVIVFAFSLVWTPVFAQTDTDPNPPASCVSIQNNLRYRDRDSAKNGEVSTLQDFLQSKGYLNSEPTGYLGLLTFQAVKDYQKSKSISPTGYVGSATKAAIASDCDGTTPNPVLPPSDDGCLSGYKYSSTTGKTCDDTTQSPSITVLSPNGGENYKAGQQITVKWSSKNLPNSEWVFIALHKDDDYNWSNVRYFNVTNDGEETITIPSDIAAGNYKVRMGSSVATVGQDYSDNYFTITSPTTPTVGYYDEFAQCLANNKISMYGASWCTFCDKQKNLFGDSFKYVPYTECSKSTTDQLQICKDKNISAYPTWINKNGSQYQGFKSLEELSGISGCNLPGKVNPPTSSSVFNKPALNTSYSTSSQNVPVGENGAKNIVKVVYDVTTNIDHPLTITELKYSAAGYKNAITTIQVGSVSADMINDTAYLTGLNLVVPAGSTGLRIEAFISYDGVGQNGTPSGSKSQIRLAYAKYGDGNTWGNAFFDSDFSPLMTLVSSSQDNSKPYVKVTSPNGGETYKPGSTLHITWTATGITSNANSIGINVFKYRSDANYYGATPEFSVTTYNPVMNGVIQDNGSYDWTIPASYSGQYVVMVGGGPYGLKDYSDGAFTISNTSQSPSITVLSPNGGETWMKGTNQKITWRDTGFISGGDFPSQYYNIKLAPDYGSGTCVGGGIGTGSCTAAFIAPYIITSSVGSYTPLSDYIWDVGKTSDGRVVPDGSYVVQVCTVGSGNSGCSTSNSYFKVVSQSVSVPVISGITGPQSLTVGQQGTWTVNASDKNEGILSYSVDWGDTTTVCSLYGAGCSTTTTSPQQSATFTHTYNTAGTYTPVFTVTNSSGQSAQTSLSVSVGKIAQINSSPQIVVRPAIPTVINPGQVVSFSWTAKDADNDDLSWSVNWGDNMGASGACNTNPTSGNGRNWTFHTSHSWVNAGTYTVKVTVNDCRDGFDSDSLTINVLPQITPSASLPVPKNFVATGTSSSSLRLSWDPVQDATSYVLKRAGSSTILYSGNETAYIDNSLSCGAVYSYSLYASNSVSKSDTVSATGSTQPCVTTIVPGTPASPSPISISSLSANALGAVDSLNGKKETPANTGANASLSSQASCGKFTALLSKGMNNDEVKCLQKKLNEKGFKVEGAESGKETSYFGYATFLALKKFQTASGLKADGIFGPASRSLIEQ